MHLYLLTRGIKPDVDRFITELQGKYLPYVFEGVNKHTQVQVRPVQFWEIVFPEPQKDLVLRSILENNQGKMATPRLQKYLFPLRKLLGCKPIPPYDYWKDEKLKTRMPFLPMYLNNVEKIGIGIKEDYYREDGTEAL